MQILTRVKLINWHRFHNETISFGDSVLISGENGAGKSTLLDAIQFVITASKHHFNKAAHENGKRKLSGYVRCKTGKENKPYERTGAVTAHIALEFYDEGRKSYYIVGAVVDSASEDSEVCVWYRMEDTEISDELFLQGKLIKNIDTFRTTNKKQIRMIDRVQANVRKDFKGRFGRLDGKFFELIPKSLAFKPIDDIKDFVYTCVLDEKEVNIEALRENVRTYQELELLLKNTRIKLTKLEKIAEHYRKVADCIKKDGFYEYYIAKAELGINQQNAVAEKRKQEKEGHAVEELKEKNRLIKTELESKRKLKENLMVELRANEEFIAINQIREEMEGLKQRIETLSETKNTLLKHMKVAVKKARELTALEEHQESKTLLEKFVRIFEDIEKCEDFTEAKSLAEEVKEYKIKKAESVSREKFNMDSKLSRAKNELVEINHMVENLSNKKLNYGPSVTRLQEAIREELHRLGRGGEVRVLCELLNITDDTWKNAIEGYLNTQKFYLLTEPEDFDLALSIYERLKEKQGLYGVGIINTGKLEAYDDEKAGSLATKITSKSVFAKRFINMILNDVVMCDKATELKQHRKAITASCMRYQNHVATVMNPKTYEIPFIGENAYKVQLEQAKAAQVEKLAEIKELEQQIVALEAVKKLTGHEEEVAIYYELSDVFDLRAAREALKRTEAQKKKLEENSTLMLKQLELEQLTEQIKRLEEEAEKNQQWQGSALTTIKNSIERVERLKEEAVQLERAVEAVEEKLGADLSLCKSEYERRVRDKDLQTMKTNYESTRKANQTTQNTAESDMKGAMLTYKSEHDFGAEASFAGYRSFEELYDRLKNSDILTYEEKVRKAKQSAEEEFREQFLSKLQENIKKAHGEFNQLNKALKTIPFGSDFYSFLHTGSKAHKQYYDMIMDEFNAIDGVSLLSGSFNEKHREVIEELFAKLTAEGEHSEKILKEFTDYRTYMDYDIKIDHGNDEFSYYSKVCEEKSGGETQTPFYVTMAASFVQLYGGSIGGDAIGLILLDEAFNNMDDERIAGVLEFFEKLPLQMIIAAPPDKIQYIQPSVKHTLLVLKEGETSYVEGFASEKL